MSKKTADKKDKNDFFNTIEFISNALEDGREIIADQTISDFQVLASRLRKQVDDIIEESRTLKIGIVGEVKAGKSSFLNAMLFDGDEILPKAPTPMTAALTKLSFSQKPETKIYFYNPDDWKVIEQNSIRYDVLVDREYQKYCEELKKREQNSLSKKAENFISGFVQNPAAPSTKLRTREEYERDNRNKFSLELRSCKELITMVKERGIDVWKYLSDKPLVIPMSDSTDCDMEKLQDYVGSKGTYTPIVKYTEIQLNNAMLDGIEVIDTPGMNDPVVSRSRVTSQYLTNCDAVFMLCYSGQFLGEEDLQFLTSLLPREGISHAVILGSKFDSGILDYPERKASFKTAYIGSRDNFIRQAKTNLEKFYCNGGNSKLVERLLSVNPQFISSLMYGAAKHKRNNEPYSAEEQNIIDRYKKRFTDFKDNAEFLADFANIDSVKEKSFKSVRDNKSQILIERSENIIQSQIGKFLNMLEDITIQTETMYKDLRNSDVEVIEKRLELIKDNLSSSRIRVKALFENAANHVLTSSNDMIIEVMKESKNHLDIYVERTHKTESHPRTEGHLWWKKTYNVTEHIFHNVVSISDLQKNINSYQDKAMEIINERFKKIIKIDELKQQIIDTVMGMFDLSDKEFNENSILQPLESAIRKISIPALDYTTEKYSKMIDSKLSGRISGGTVKDDDIPCLKSAQIEIMTEIRNDLKDNIENQCKKTGNMLISQGTVFIDNIESQIDETTIKLTSMLILNLN